MKTLEQYDAEVAGIIAECGEEARKVGERFLALLQPVVEEMVGRDDLPEHLKMAIIQKASAALDELGASL